MATSKKTITKPFWIIINRKKNSVWKNPYLSFEEARKELMAQESLILHRKHGWVIEQMERRIEIDDIPNSDGFNNF